MNWVVHELCRARYLTKEAACDMPTAKRLYGAIAELTQLGGWLAEDQGRYEQGQQYLLAALRASGPRATGIWARTSCAALAPGLARDGGARRSSVTSRCSSTGHRRRPAR
ncbi:hypothetical protein AB0952_17745 [Streptomyces caniferus]|uniref:hypothetical protein n=1 Tax=Streptomyces caniferus TaxID=285557 RepID=UPI00345709CB